MAIQKQSLQFFPFTSHPVRRDAETRHLRLHPEHPDVFLEMTPDGPDYIRVCVRHQWASIPHPEHASACPLCVAEFDEQRGRERYAALQRPNVVIAGVFES